MQYSFSSPLPPAMKSKQTCPVHGVSLQASWTHLSICTAPSRTQSSAERIAAQAQGARNYARHLRWQHRDRALACCELTWA